MKLVIGVDGGGTSCRAAVADATGRILGRAVTGPANIRSDPEGARTNIVAAAEEAFLAAGLDTSRFATTPAVLGLAGSNVGTYRERTAAALPFRDSVIVSDGLVSLEGAVGPGDGAIAILGTGSVFMARRDAEVRTIGGWGFLLGDHGGGAPLGRNALSLALLAYDGLVEHTALTRTLLDRFANDPRAVVEFTTGAKPADFGKFAPLVFELSAAGDPAAADLIEDQVEMVAGSIRALALTDKEPLALLGGLAELYRPLLPDDIAALVRDPLADGLTGAVSLALRTFA